MALYPTLFGYVEVPDPDHRRPSERPADVRLVRRPRPFPLGERR
jgi:hypothetical protein